MPRATYRVTVEVPLPDLDHRPREQALALLSGDHALAVCDRWRLAGWVLHATWEADRQDYALSLVRNHVKPGRRVVLEIIGED